MSPKAIARIRLAALLLVVLLLQTTIVPDVRVFGACPDLMLLCTICAGLVGGAEVGGLVGFTAGLLTDLFLLTTPLGLSALSYCLIGYGVGTVRRSFLQEGWLLAPATALIASAAGVVTFVLAGVMVGQSQLTRIGPTAIIRTAVIVGVMNAIVAAPVARVLAWASAGLARTGPSRAELSAQRLT
ncbi:MAG: rod shape-determining protein MreD [Actinomycetota bacterium]|nr:rod shape-determining protein MreD [Actinomycetota bacterium]